MLRKLALSGIPLILFTYLVLTLFPAYSSAGVLMVGAIVFLFLFGAILWVPLVYWREDRDFTTRMDRILQWTAFLAMGWLSFVLVMSLARDFLSLFLFAQLRSANATSLILGLAAICSIVGFLIAHFGIRARKEKILFPNLAPELHGFRIVQLSDVHVGPTIRKSFVTRLTRIVNRQNSDVLVITGDVADGLPSDLTRELEPFREMNAKLGKYYVPGNHEYYWSGPAWIEKMRELGFTPLLNENRVLDVKGNRLAIAGVTDPAARATGNEGPDLARAAQNIPSDAYPRILLCHQPQIAANSAEKAGFQLQLSGHTHAGQFFPWTLVVRKIYGELTQGLTRVGALYVYVNRGTGYWGPPLRLGSPPEISVLDLVRPHPTENVIDRTVAIDGDKSDLHLPSPASINWINCNYMKFS